MKNLLTAFMLMLAGNSFAQTAAPDSCNLQQQALSGSEISCNYKPQLRCNASRNQKRCLEQAFCC